MNLNQYWNEGAGENGEGLDKLCCGCSGCEQVCPKNAISMKMDENGFYYPVINGAVCVDCGLCVKKCQCISNADADIPNKVSISNIIETKEVPKVYAVVSQNEKALPASSSGGISYELGECILKQDGVVFGAVYSDTMEIIHQKIDSLKELSKIQGSKYAQSRIGDTYKQAEECLKNSKKVLFTGTPCQIGGLYQFLGKDYLELYTMDIICYGVASPGIFRDYVRWKEEKAKGKIKNINFRSKIDCWGISITEIDYLDKKKQFRYSDDDEWYQTFLSHMATRESCHFCMYTNVQRKADITAGDYWGIEKCKPDLNCRTGLSKVLLNTKKGEKLFGQIQKNVWAEQMEIESAIRPNLQNPPKRSEKREAFFAEYEKVGFYEAYQKYVAKKVPLKVKVKRWMKIKIKCKAGR